VASFIQSINSGYKLPLINIEVDPSQAGTPVQNLEALLVGYMLSTGTAQPNKPVACGSISNAKTLFGEGSMLARMFEMYFAVDQGTPIICLPVSEPSAGVAATGSVTFAGPAAQPGTLNLYIAGQKVSVAVGLGDTAAQLATKAVAALSAAPSLPVTAAVDGTTTSKVNLTARHKGIALNEIRVEDSILGINGGETVPAGVTITYPTGNVLSGGTGVPDWSTPIGALNDDPYEWTAMPFTDTGSLQAWDTEFGFTDAGRWGWIRQTYGQIFQARKDTYQGHFTWGQLQNSGVISTMEDELASPTPSWELAAIYTADAAKSLGNDPGLPLQFLPLTGHIPAPRDQRFSRTELNGLAHVGLAIKDVRAGVSTIMREQTQYQKSVTGRPDNAYELVTTLSTLATIFRRLIQAVEQTYGRCKLADDGTRIKPGARITTPALVKAFLCALYDLMEDDGLVENSDAFAANLVVQRAADADTLEVYFPPDIINGLRRFNVRAGFRLQFQS